MFDLLRIEESEKKSDDKFTIINGDSNPELKGNIYLTENSKLVSRSFGEAKVVKFTNDSFLKFFEEVKEKDPNHYFTPCYEGPHVKVWFDEDKEIRFSNDNKIDCLKSFWGNKEETFGELFFKNGGDKFVEKLSEETKIPGYTHHFMILNRNLLITTRLDMRDNETVIVYLGTTTLEGKILEVTSIDPEVYFYNIDRANVLPLKSELSSRILLPTKINFQEAYHVLTNGYEMNNYEPSLDKSLIKGECIVFRNGVDRIIKFTPDNYETRSFIAGSTPNIKNRLYNLLEKAKNIEDYEDNFPIVGTLTDSQLSLVKENDKRITTFGINAFIKDKKVYNPNSLEDRMNNILVLCLLTCPLTKVNLFIDAWFDYRKSREKIINFIRNHNSDIRNNKYDEKLSQFHKKALERMKDIAKVSKNYANDNSNGFTYNSRMIYSLKGLLKNEFGPSLYRIEKAISFIQE